MAEQYQFVEVNDTGNPHWTTMLPVLSQLREGLDLEQLNEILGSTRGQQPRFTGLFVGSDCVCVAGWRLMANIHLGLVLYVDDLVVDQTHRSQGYGQLMLEELARIASRAGARAVDLDSGVQRFGAHRFYFANGYSIVSHHFRRMLNDRES